MPADLVLALVVLCAFTVEAALGFGATVVAVSLGAFALPIDEILPAFVPLNLVISLFLVARYRAHVDVRLLLRQVLPLMALGLPLGLYALAHLDAGVAKAVFGAFVVVLAALELVRMHATTAAPVLSRPRSALLLFLGGVVHGAFATGGPLVVYVASRRLDDKAAFRATLSALWLVLNLVLLAAYAARGALDLEAARRSLLLLPSLGGGLVVGELLHRRVNAAHFKMLVSSLLLVAGALLVARS